MAGRSSPGSAERTPLLLRVYRHARVSVHVFQGIATTAFVFPFIGLRGRQALIRSWSEHLLRLMNIESRVRGMPRDGLPGNMLIVANHVSWLDIFVLNTVQPARFIAKSELRRWPLVGLMISGCGTLFLERERRRVAHRVNDRARDVRAAGDTIAIFQEGTTTDGTSLLPVHGSLLQPVIDAGGHVQPIAIRYLNRDGSYCDAPAYVGELTFMSSFWRVLGERAMVVEMTLTPPLATPGRHRRELSRASEQAIREVLGSSAPAPWNSRRSSSLRAVSVPSPEATRVEHQDVGSEHQIERRPVSAKNRGGGGPALTVREPWRIAFRRVRDAALFGKLHAVVGRAKPQSRAGVDDDAEAIMSGERRFPARWPVAIQRCEECVVFGRSHNGFDFPGQHFRGRGSPRREQPGMHHQQLAAANHEGTCSQPRQQFIAIGRAQDRVKRVLPVRGAVARGDGQQVEVVIAEDGDGCGPEPPDGAQDRERVGAAIDEVPHQPEQIGGRIEGDHFEQLPEFGVASLDVADDVVAHGAGTNSKGAVKRRAWLESGSF